MRAYLRDNKIPDPNKFVEMQEFASQIIAAVDRRCLFYDETKAIDMKFILPDANWHKNAPNDYLKAYQIISSLKWEEIRHLRFRTQTFTGFSLRHMCGGFCGGNAVQRTNSTEIVPDDYDEQIPEIPPHALVQRYREVSNHTPNEFRIKPPNMLGENGWWVDGVLLNHDTVSYQERMSLLYHAGLLKNDLKILEIGGGYGALAYSIKKSLLNINYVICDIPESLLFSGIYIALVDDSKVPIIFLPNYDFHEFIENGHGIRDLVINTLSMSEMSLYQVEEYAKGISKLIGNTGVFFEQNQGNSPEHGIGNLEDILRKHFNHMEIVQAPFTPYNGQPKLWSNK